MKTSFFSAITGILLFALVIVSAGATEVVLRDGVLIVEDQNDEYGLGAFNIILVYGSDVSLEAGEWMYPYSGAINVQNQEGITRIGGLTTSADAPKGDVPLIRLGVNGSGTVTVYVNEFYNVMGDPIKTVNPTYREGTTGPISGDVTPTAVPTAVPESPVETTQESGGQPICQTESTGAGSQVQTGIPVLTEGPIQISTTPGIDTDVTETIGVNSASMTEPLQSPTNSLFVMLSLLVSFIVFQSIYMKKD
ncbi:hypothetical protein Metli_2291 [Methanofollis liminatans DSM 4140]|uniref:Uncharacterized protein n=1 Tax=Methanofollis liminatans DSM 4140 TaxID=28892 RepID=J0SBV8_9EURY|nr:hypothetical protein [Methanofollis liminatans]EJG08229.1 hypothetical protein Metli_2291 [Methanofollis liminatans DSM 4140]